MKKLMALAIVSVFSLSAAAASACDGMKGHDRAADSAKNDNGKADGKGDTKAKTGSTGTTKSRADESANKS